MLFIISGPSGVGKTTVCEAVINSVPNLVRLISHTTRKPRKRSNGTLEVHGVDYYFSDNDYEFSQAEIIEYSTNYGHFYWTEKSDLEKLIASGADVLCNVNTEGGLNLKRLYPDSVSVFIRPSSSAVLEKRLRERASDNDIEARLAAAQSEIITGRLEYDYIITNEDLEMTIQELAYLIDYVRDTNVKVDFHTHTNASDGTLSPQQLVDAAKESGVKILAITDHNYITKIKDLHNRDITIIPGVEASCCFTGSSGTTYEVHIVGLGIDAEHSALNNLLERNREDRQPYITAILDKLRECNINLGSYEDIAAKYSNTMQLGRMHIAKEMVRGGFVSSTDEAFRLYLGSFGEKRAYVPNQQFFAPMSFMIHHILDAGGIPVLAHPFYYQMPFDDFLDLLISFSVLSEKRGAIEVFYPNHTKEQTMQLADIASRLGLKYSAGSDYHANGCDTLGIGFTSRMCSKLLEKLGIKF